MNPEDIIGAVLRGVLNTRPDRSARTLRRLSHGHLLSTRNVVAAAAAAWGMYEAMQGQARAETLARTGGVANPIDLGGSSGTSGPLPTPRFPTSDAGSGRVASAPPLPIPGRPSQPARPAAPPPPPPQNDRGYPPDLARALRLLIAAARADGDLKPEEGAVIARHAADAGAESFVRAELQVHPSLEEILGDVKNPAVAAELYRLAFTVLRADEDVNTDERTFLEELETRLKLEPTTARRIEEEVAGAIDAEPDPPLSAS